MSRLTDEQINGLANMELPDPIAQPAVHGVFSLQKELAAEIREWRSGVAVAGNVDGTLHRVFLTGREMESLAFARERVFRGTKIALYHLDAEHAAECDRSLAVLDKLLARKGQP